MSDEKKLNQTNQDGKLEETSGVSQTKNTQHYNYLEGKMNNNFQNQKDQKRKEKIEQIKKEKQIQVGTVLRHEDVHNDWKAGKLHNPEKYVPAHTGTIIAVGEDTYTIRMHGRAQTEEVCSIFDARFHVVVPEDDPLRNVVLQKNI